MMKEAKQEKHLELLVCQVSILFPSLNIEKKFINLMEPAKFYHSRPHIPPFQPSCHVEAYLALACHAYAFDVILIIIKPPASLIFAVLTSFIRAFIRETRSR